MMLHFLIFNLGFRINLEWGFCRITLYLPCMKNPYVLVNLYYNHSHGSWSVYLFNKQITKGLL